MEFAGFDLSDLLLFIGAGFIAQLVDGALGMAFGVISTTLLISLGVPPAAASAGVHTVETATTAVSAVSHVAHRNVEWRLFFRLGIPGIAGGVLGAYVLSGIDASAVKPFILAYLASIGLFLIWRGMGHPPHPKPARMVEPIGLAGGFLDAVGGGGWGPVVTGNLLVQGADPCHTIGTVNTVEFFLAASISGAFVATLGWQAFTVATVGLLIGGVAAAPFGALVARKARPKLLLLLVGSVLTLTSIYGIYRAMT